MLNGELNGSEKTNFYKESLTAMFTQLSDLIDQKKQWGICRDGYLKKEKYLEISDEKVNFTESLKDYNNKKKIALVLESPHIKEFNEKGEGIEPAQGYTGDNLKNYLPDLIKDINFDKKLNGLYEMKIINAIRYQTSLGLNTKIFRDRIWLSCWLRGGSDDFFNRINKYNPDIIINLCTKGSHDDDLVVNLNQIRAKTIINKEYLETITKSLTFNKDRSITKNNVEVYAKRWLDKKNYTLNGFVQTTLDEYKKNHDRIILIRGIHPSSDKFSESDLEVVE